MIAYPLNETSWLSSIQPSKNVTLPAFFSTQFTLPKNYTKCLDTYLDTSGWTKVRFSVFTWIVRKNAYKTYIFNTPCLVSYTLTGCSVYKWHKSGSVLASRRSSSHALRTGSIFKTAACHQHAYYVRAWKRPTKRICQIRRQTHSKRAYNGINVQLNIFKHNMCTCL